MIHDDDSDEGGYDDDEEEAKPDVACQLHGLTSEVEGKKGGDVKEQEAR